MCVSKNACLSINEKNWALLTNGKKNICVRLIAYFIKKYYLQQLT